jgi:hypothetical protein
VASKTKQMVGGGKGGGAGRWGEMTQTLYAHMNKIKIRKTNKQTWGKGERGEIT